MQNIPKIQGLKEVIHKYSNYFFDLDGVMWRGDDDIQGSLQTLKLLRSENKRVFFVTNSSVRTRTQLKRRFSLFGLQVDIDQCFPSSYIAGQYLAKKHPQIKNVLCFGSNFLEQQLKQAGLQAKRIVDLPKFQKPIQIAQKYLDESVDGIVVGWDSEMTFAKSCLIGFHLQRGAKFFGTNPDKFTMIRGFRVPGCGSILASIEQSLGIKAQIMGKPNTFIIDHIIAQNSLKKNQCIMVGDNMQTDITFGNSAQIDTLCVLSGVSKQQDVLKSQSLCKPTYYSKCIGF